MSEPKRILVFQTAFLGDVILTLPMIQLLKQRYPESRIDVVTTPGAASLLANHPAIAMVIPYDKRNAQKGLKGIVAMAVFLQRRKYDIAVVPHRSFRSALVIGLSGISVRIGFSNAAGRFFYNRIGIYHKSKHEIERNLELLSPLGITSAEKEFPSLFPSDADKATVNRMLFEREIIRQERMIAIAPGSVWNTKRWPVERFAELASLLAKNGFEVVVIGGREDEELGTAIVSSAEHKRVHNMTGRLTLLQSAEVIGKCAVLVTNDSAPLHIGVAMRTRVAAIFGATVPAFGFAPYGENHIVIETEGLDCRPCAIHGGTECPIGTFVCMKNIEAESVFRKVVQLMERKDY